MVLTFSNEKENLNPCLKVCGFTLLEGTSQSSGEFLSKVRVAEPTIGESGRRRPGSAAGSAPEKDHQTEQNERDRPVNSQRFTNIPIRNIIQIRQDKKSSDAAKDQRCGEKKPVANVIDERHEKGDADDEECCRDHDVGMHLDELRRSEKEKERIEKQHRVPEDLSPPVSREPPSGTDKPENHHEGPED